MDTKILLLEDRPQQLKNILNRLGKSEQNLLDDVKILKTWLKEQAHLPEIPDNIMIQNFLFMNKFSIENTKQKLDMYYTIRSLIPEMYEGKNPSLPHMVKTAEIAYNLPLPKITKEGYRVTALKHVNDNPGEFDAYNTFAQFYNIMEIRIHEDVTVGDVLLYDCGNLRMGHIIKFTPIAIKNCIIVLEKVFSSRLKQILFINCPPYIDKLLFILKQFLKAKLFKRIQVQKGADKLSEFISKEILPEDYGGDEIPMCKLNELWKQKVAEYQKRFDTLDTLTTNEDLRPTPLVNDDILGYYGNFKKLDIY